MAVLKETPPTEEQEDYSAPPIDPNATKPTATTAEEIKKTVGETLEPSESLPGHVTQLFGRIWDQLFAKTFQEAMMLAPSEASKSALEFTLVNLEGMKGQIFEEMDRFVRSLPPTALNEVPEITMGMLANYLRPQWGRYIDAANPDLPGFSLILTDQKLIVTPAFNSYATAISFNADETKRARQQFLIAAALDRNKLLNTAPGAYSRVAKKYNADALTSLWNSSFESTGDAAQATKYATTFYEGDVEVLKAQAADEQLAQQFGTRAMQELSRFIADNGQENFFLRAQLAEMTGEDLQEAFDQARAGGADTLEKIIAYFRENYLEPVKKQTERLLAKTELPGASPEDKAIAKDKFVEGYRKKLLDPLAQQLSQLSTQRAQLVQQLADTTQQGPNGEMIEDPGLREQLTAVDAQIATTRQKMQILSPTQLEQATTANAQAVKTAAADTKTQKKTDDVTDVLNAIASHWRVAKDFDVGKAMDLALSDKTMSPTDIVNKFKLERKTEVDTETEKRNTGFFGRAQTFGADEGQPGVQLTHGDVFGRPADFSKYDPADLNPEQIARTLYSSNASAGLQELLRPPIDNPGMFKPVSLAKLRDTLTGPISVGGAEPLSAAEIGQLGGHTGRVSSLIQQLGNAPDQAPVKEFKTPDELRGFMEKLNTNLYQAGSLDTANAQQARMAAAQAQGKMAQERAQQAAAAVPKPRVRRIR